jgi:hypothetical protein
MSTDPEPMHISEPPRPPSVIIQAEIEDLEREVRAARRKERWHFVWALTGISPAALIPGVGLFLDESFDLFILLLVLVSFSQFYLGTKAAGKVARLKRALNGLREKEHTVSQ